MASITSARQKLESAVERLESAAKMVSKEGGGGRDQVLELERDKLDAQLTALRVKHESLEQRYSSAQGEYEALEKVIDRVSDRLDATIGRLRDVLEG